MKSRTAASEAREAEADVSEKAWEAGPRREVPAARGVAAHPCDDLPGPGQRVTWVGDRAPHPRYFWKEAQSRSVQPRRVGILQVAGDPGTVDSGVGLAGSPWDGVSSPEPLMAPVGPLSGLSASLLTKGMTPVVNTSFICFT